MSKKKVSICCGGSDDLTQDFSCSFEETEKGFTFSVTSDDPEKVEKLKARMKSCCDSSSDESCCESSDSKSCC